MNIKRLLIAITIALFLFGYVKLNVTYANDDKKIYVGYSNLNNYTIDATCKIKVYAPVPDPDIDLDIYEVVYTGSYVNEVHDIIFNSDTGEIVEDYSSYINENDVYLLANVVFGEARGIESKAQRAAVVWCVLNRLDSGRWGNTLYDVLSSKNQFDGFDLNRKYSEQDLKTLKECKELARDVLERYYHEIYTLEANVGRTLPKDYLFFYGKNGENKFTKEWRQYDTIWDWSMEDPYVEEVL